VVKYSSDTTKPTDAPVVTGTLGTNNWYTSDVSVAWNWTDEAGGSGIDAANCTQNSDSGGVEGALVPVSSSCQDLAGNQASDSRSFNIDKTAPTTGFAISPTSPDGNNGWYMTAPAVTLTPSDGTSGVASTFYTINGGSTQTYTGPFTLPDGSSDVVTYWSTDNAGNVEATNTSATYMVDTVPPTASPTPSPPANAAGWNNTDVTVNFNWADSGSGLNPPGVHSNCATPSTSSGEGTITLKQSCTDLAGNTGTDSYTVKVDKTKPTISAAATTAPNGSNQWYTSDVTVHFTCADALSGIPTGTCPADQTLSSEGSAVSSVAETVSDAAGNVSDPSNVVTVKIDKTPPTISVSHTPDGSSGWNVTNPVSIKITASDATSGLAGAPTCTDNGNPLTVTGSSSPYSASVSGDGSHSISCTVDDNAGNTSDPGTDTVKIDTVPPSVSGAPTTSPNGAGWYKSNVTVHWTCSDATSGLAAGCPSDSTISTEGTGLTASSGLVYDNAGNSASATSSPAVKIDKTPPSLNPTLSAATIYLNQTGVTASPNATDATSGVASSSCGVIDASTVGDHTVTCTATDNAGNSNSSTIHYTVGYKVLGFFSPVPGAKWKTGQTVPVKIGLGDVNGARISDAAAAALLSPTCMVKFSATGAQTTAPTCMKYDTTSHQFIFNWMLGKKTGAETITVTVSYPSPASTTVKSEPITITS
jgi:hypothetical protein